MHVVIIARRTLNCTNGWERDYAGTPTQVCGTLRDMYKKRVGLVPVTHEERQELGSTMGLVHCGLPLAVGRGHMALEAYEIQGQAFGLQTG